MAEVVMDAITDAKTLEELKQRLGDKPQRKLTRRRWISIVSASVAILAACGYGYYWWTVGSYFQGTDDAYVGGNVTPIAPHISGFIAQVAVADNQEVKAGQLLIRLDDRDTRAALAHAQAVLAQRQATLGSLQAQYVLQQSTIEQASADVDAKSAQAEFARLDAERYRTLARTNDASQQQAQKTDAADRAARGALTAAQAALAAAKQQLRVLSAQIEEASAAVAQAKADLETAQLNLGYTEIRSPIDGFIGNRAAQVGAYAAQGTYLLSVAPAHGLWIDANFKEDQLARMAPGQPVSIAADVLPGKVFHGHVLSLAPATGAVFSVIPPENATGNFTKIVQRVPVRIGLDGDDAALGQIRPGLSIYATVDTRSNARAVP
jgi:membrane fusion protein, multidrug efflux system